MTYKYQKQGESGQIKIRITGLHALQQGRVAV